MIGVLVWGLFVCLLGAFLLPTSIIFYLGKNFLQKYIVVAIGMCLEDLQTQERSRPQTPAAVLSNPLLCLLRGYVLTTGHGRDTKAGSFLA